MDKKIVILGGMGKSTYLMYNGLNAVFQIERLIIEQPVDKKKFLKRRIKKLGLITVIGQILFQFICVPILSFFSKNRIKEILHDQKISYKEPDNFTIVKSVNSKDCITLLQSINPDIIVVNGTRIISKKVLASVSAIFVNTHVGITPKYRGVHGGYWALANDDIENCGVTVHLIDEGIDTGGVLFQKKVKTTHKDNFITYPLLQISEGIKLMEQALKELGKGKISVKNSPKESKLWSHPTIWKYLSLRFFKGVK